MGISPLLSPAQTGSGFASRSCHISARCHISMTRVSSQDYTGQSDVLASPHCRKIAAVFKILLCLLVPLYSLGEVGALPA